MRRRQLPEDDEFIPGGFFFACPYMSVIPFDLGDDSDLIARCRSGETIETFLIGSSRVPYNHIDPLYVTPLKPSWEWRMV